MPEETVADRHYRYLVGGEAFDWLLLAERLTESLDGAMPEDEREALLFFGQMPVDLDDDEFKGAIGGAKHTAHLNYLYGVTVEEALQLAVEEEVHKERFAHAATATPADEEVCRRVYGKGRMELLERFREECGLPPSDSICLQRPQGLHLLALQVPPAQLRPRARRLRYAAGDDRSSPRWKKIRRRRSKRRSA